MTREDIIERMGWMPVSDYEMSEMLDRIERTVAAAVEAEREACAEICDGEATIYYSAQRCATKIRARGCQK